MVVEDLARDDLRHVQSTRRKSQQSGSRLCNLHLETWLSGYAHLKPYTTHIAMLSTWTIWENTSFLYIWEVSCRVGTLLIQPLVKKVCECWRESINTKNSYAIFFGNILLFSLVFLLFHHVTLCEKSLVGSRSYMETPSVDFK